MFYSQWGQDKFLNNNVFKGYMNGTFVDIGAHDGKLFNNTLFFEETYNWTGINIEAIPSVYDKLKINRLMCKNLNFAISNSNNVVKDFMINTGHTEMLSGLVETYDKRHLLRIQNESLQHNCSMSIVKVVTRTLESIFLENKISNINLLSIDTEGSEFDVIKSINFNNVFIDVICFENNYDDVSYPIIEYLEDNGYYIFKLNSDIYMIHKNSKFLTAELEVYTIKNKK
jgi:FkbM family methyltransferase